VQLLHKVTPCLTLLVQQVALRDNIVLRMVRLAIVAAVPTYPNKEFWAAFLEMKRNHLHFGRLK
jgi:hypothetical protein